MYCFKRLVLITFNSVANTRKIIIKHNDLMRCHCSMSPIRLLVVLFKLRMFTVQVIKVCILLLKCVFCV